MCVSHFRNKGTVKNPNYQKMQFFFYQIAMIHFLAGVAVWCYIAMDWRKIMVFVAIWKMSIAINTQCHLERQHCVRYVG